MKNFFFAFFLLLTGCCLAQEQLTTVHLAPGSTLHFISPEPIQYVDISSRSLAGNLALTNVFSLKIKDTARAFNGAVVTIAGEKFIAQYRVMPGGPLSDTQVNIGPPDCKPLDIAGIGFSQPQLKAMVLQLFSTKPRQRIEKVKAFGIEGSLNQVYSAGDYLFLDISYHNGTTLKYDIDNIAFQLDDRKVTKASNVQRYELKPVFSLFEVAEFARCYRNIFVLRKLSFPGNKVLHIVLSEKQISGRLVSLTVSYRDVLNADTLPREAVAENTPDPGTAGAPVITTAPLTRPDLAGSLENQ